MYTWFCYYIISDSSGTVHYIAQIRVIVSWKTSNVVQYNIFRLPRTMLRILCALCCRKTAVRVSQYLTLVHCVKTAKHIEKSRILLVLLLIMSSFSFTQTNSLPYQLVASWKGSKLQGNHSPVPSHDRISSPFLPDISSEYLRSIDPCNRCKTSQRTPFLVYLCQEQYSR